VTYRHYGSAYKHAPNQPCVMPAAVAPTTKEIRN